MIDFASMAVNGFAAGVFVMFAFVIFIHWYNKTFPRFKMFIVYTLIFGILSFVIIKMKFGVNTLEGEAQKFYDNFNVSFIGKVYNYDTYESSPHRQIGGGPKFNIYFLEIYRSSVENYDPSDTTDDFYCIIRDSVGIVIEETIRKDIGGGDILYYNGEKDLMYHITFKARKIGPGEWTQDTILNSKWRPENIIGQPHRRMFYDKYRKEWAPQVFKDVWSVEP